MFPERYRILKLNLFTGETSVDFVTLSQTEEYEKYGYLSYWEEFSGQSVLISKFGEDTYQCVGKCYCEDYDRRRSKNSVLSRNLLYLATALTSLVAYDRAKEYFESECQKTMSEVCDSHSIRSEVDGCEITVHGQNIDGEREKPGNDQQRRRYHCQGHCISRDYKRLRFLDENMLASSKKKELTTSIQFFCRSLYSSGEIVLRSSTEGLSGDEYYYYHTQTDRARSEFDELFMRSFCQESSYHEVVDEKVCTSSPELNVCLQTYPETRNKYALEMKNMDMIIRMKQMKVIKNQITFEAMLQVDRVIFGDEENDYFDPIVNKFRDLGPEYKYDETNNHECEVDWLSPASYNAWVLDNFHDILEREERIRVLDIGTGSGYTLAIFAHIVCPKGGKVLGLEIDPENFERAITNLKKEEKTRDWLESGCIQLRNGDGLSFGGTENFDIIHTGFVVGEKQLELCEYQQVDVEDELFDQLKVGGKMIFSESYNWFGGGEGEDDMDEEEISHYIIEKDKDGEKEIRRMDYYYDELIRKQMKDISS